MPCAAGVFWLPRPMSPIQSRSSKRPKSLWSGIIRYWLPDGQTNPAQRVTVRRGLNLALVIFPSLRRGWTRYRLDLERRKSTCNPQAGAVGGIVIIAAPSISDRFGCPSERGIPIKGVVLLLPRIFQRSFIFRIDQVIQFSEKMIDDPALWDVLRPSLARAPIYNVGIITGSQQVNRDFSLPVIGAKPVEDHQPAHPGHVQINKDHVGCAIEISLQEVVDRCLPIDATNNGLFESGTDQGSLVELDEVLISVHVDNA